jgi:hypothetical protein
LPPSVSRPWQPDPVLLKLIAVAQNNTAASADGLKHYAWSAPPAVAAGRPGGEANAPIVAGPDVADEFLRSLDALVDQMDRLVREHPAGKGLAIRADVIVEQRQARTAASETVLQKAAVDLEAAAGLLEWLIEASDATGQSKPAVAALHAERERAAAAAPNVLYEMREACYYNLALWDLLLTVPRSSP